MSPLYHIAITYSFVVTGGYNKDKKCGQVFLAINNNYPRHLLAKSNNLNLNLWHITKTYSKISSL